MNEDVTTVKFFFFFYQSHFYTPLAFVVYGVLNCHLI